MDNNNNNNNNNNKRKEISNDDDNNNNKITYKKFKSEIELSKISYKELQSIAGDLGLLKNGKKEELYENIEKYLLNSESIKPIEIINPFNKDAPKLLITQEDELPFWKVFRNKSLFIKIFSNFKYKRIDGYKDLKCSKEFLLNYSNSINILIDNIKNSKNHQIIMNGQDIQNIISTILKDNKETRSFYNLLFSTYSSNSITNVTDIELDCNIESWINFMIVNKNHVALDEYIKYNNINKELVKIECSKCNYGQRIFDISKHLKINLKFLNFLIENEMISISNKEIKDNTTINNKNRFNKNKEIKLKEWTIDEYLKHILNSSRNNYLYEYRVITSDFYNLNIKLKSLFKIYKLLLSIYQKFSNSTTHIDIKNKDIFNKLIIEINEIGDINQHFTINELNLTINEYLKSNKSSKLKIEIISKYFKSIHKFDNSGTPIKQESILLNYLFQFKLYIVNNGNEKEYIYKQMKKPIKNINNYYNNIIHYFSYLFKLTNCQNDKLELVSSLFNESSKQPLDLFFNGGDGSGLRNYLNFLTTTNDIQCIELFINNFIKKYDDDYFNTRLHDYIFHYCEFTIEIMDLFYSKFKDNSALFQSDYYLDKFNSTTLEHYENLMKSIDRKIENINVQELFVLNRIISNPSVYNIHMSSYDFRKAIIPCRNHGSNESLQLLFTLSNIQFAQNQVLDLDNLISHYNNYKERKLLSTNPILKFLFENISNETISINLKKIINNNSKEEEFQINFTKTFENNSATVGGNGDLAQHQNEFEQFIIAKPTFLNFKISIGLLFEYFYSLGRIDDIIYLFDTVPEILKYSSNDRINLLKLQFYNNLSTFYLELFINYFLNNLNEYSINHLYECLCIASRKGIISIFKSLVSTHCDLIFKIRTNSNNQSLFESKLLFQLVKISNSFELKNLLKKYINFSPKILKTVNKL